MKITTVGCYHESWRFLVYDHVVFSLNFDKIVLSHSLGGIKV
jgi:hypothetical protein